MRPVRSHGTVNALFRLGEDVVLRFPLQPRLDARHRAELVREQALARQIAPQVPLAVPEPLGLGEPGEGYAGPWTAYRWIEGDPASPETITDESEFACGLADFVAAFRAMPTGGQGWDGSTRGGPLLERDTLRPALLGQERRPGRRRRGRRGLGASAWRSGSPNPLPPCGSTPT